MFEAAWPAIRDGGRAELELPIANVDRAVGARLGGAIGKAFGSVAPPGSARARFHGAAGQSFGAFLSDGVELQLIGEANDYVGKGMGGGRIVIGRPPGTPEIRGSPGTRCCTAQRAESSSSPAGRRALRRPQLGRSAVVEGVGDHACEYMTGGTVVVLGPVGMNLAAGMTGGELFVHDPDGDVPIRLNPELVEARMASPEALERLRRLVERHHELSGSARAGRSSPGGTLTVRRCTTSNRGSTSRRSSGSRRGRG